MGQMTESYIKFYNVLYAGMEAKQPIVTKEVDETIPSRRVLDDAKDITLAQFDPVSKDFVTAHRLKDYRRKKFELMLLPDIRILLDYILKGRKGWSE